MWTQKGGGKKEGKGSKMAFLSFMGGFILGGKKKKNERGEKPICSAKKI